jgi:predicted transposase YdaD
MGMVMGIPIHTNGGWMIQTGMAPISIARTTVHSYYCAHFTCKRILSTRYYMRKEGRKKGRKEGRKKERKKETGNRLALRGRSVPSQEAGESGERIMRR